MKSLLISIRDKLTTAIAYLRMHRQDDDELEDSRQFADNALDNAVKEIDSALDSHENN